MTLPHLLIGSVIVLAFFVSLFDGLITVLGGWCGKRTKKGLMDIEFFVSRLKAKMNVGMTQGTIQKGKHLTESLQLLLSLHLSPRTIKRSD
jgi:hypothetical protein